MIWFDTFKANIASTQTMPSNKGKIRLAMPTYPIFTFTKDSILFPKLDDEHRNALAKGQIYHRSKYTLYRLTRHDEAYTKDSKFQVIFNDSEKYNIKTNWRNNVLLKIVHKRYWVQRNFDTIGKALVTIIASIISGVVVGRITYNLGFNAGLKEGRTKAKSEQPSSMKQPKEDSVGLTKHK